MSMQYFSSSFPPTPTPHKCLAGPLVELKTPTSALRWARRWEREEVSWEAAAGTHLRAADIEGQGVGVARQN